MRIGCTLEFWETKMVVVFTTLGGETPSHCVVGIQMINEVGNCYILRATGSIEYVR